MRIGRFDVGKWAYPDPKEKKFIWFEYLSSYCGCKFVTISNIVFSYYDKDCGQ